MRTTKKIKIDVKKALIEYQNHCKNCETCNSPLDCNGEEIDCSEAEWLYKEYDEFNRELNYAEKVFNAELLEREDTCDCNKNSFRVVQSGYKVCNNCNQILPQK